MAQQQQTFLVTQINQNNQQNEQSKEENLEHEKKKVDQPQSPQDQEEQDEEIGLKKLLSSFNSYDKQEKGLINLQQAEEIIKNFNVNAERTKEYHIMSLPLFSELLTFDEFLFVFVLSENTSQDIEEKYRLCKKVDKRLVQFLKLLNNYRKKSERSGNYKQAKNSKIKVQQIRERQLQRRYKYLNILYDKEIKDLQEKQKVKFFEFCEKWDQFMNEYESTASQILRKLKDRHEIQQKQYEERNRQQLASKMHFSKHLLELQLKEKNLVKLQEYEKAGKIQVEIEDLKNKQLHEKELSDQQTLNMRLVSFRKQLQSSVNTLLQKIQKDRNDHMKQRQSDSERLMVKHKTLFSQIDHRHSEALKRVYEALHNMNLDYNKHKSK